MITVWCPPNCSSAVQIPCTKLLAAGFRCSKRSATAAARCWFHEAVSMRVALNIALTRTVALLVALPTVASIVATEACAQAASRQPVAIQFSLDRPIDAAATPFVLGTASGLFGAEGL